jgi:hypothetical protein
MSSDRSYLARNDAERARLKALVARASDADLARSMPAGWTVASVLGHLAFWDQRIVTLIETWERTGAALAPIHGTDVDWVNDAGKPFLLALPPRQVAEMAVAIAEAVDRKVAAASQALIDANAKAGNPLSLDRATHRREHLDEIDKILK